MAKTQSDKDHGERITGTGRGIDVFDRPSTDKEVQERAAEAKRLQDEILGPDPDEVKPDQGSGLTDADV